MRLLNTTFAISAQVLMAIGAASLPALAHSFPDPNDPELKAEQATADFTAARAAASANGVSPGVIGAADSVYSSFLLWPSGAQGAVVPACFWNGAETIQQAVIDSDKAWQKIAAISLNYLTQAGKIRICSSSADADIRIVLDSADSKVNTDYDVGRPAAGFWSLVGRQSNFTPPGKLAGVRYKVTVNLPNIGTFLSMGDLDDFNFLVRHELGHARGLLHEHQRTECSGWFDIDAIAASQHWSHDYAAQAVASFSQLPSSTNFYKPAYVGGYDILSIMQYNFEKNWYKEVPGKTNPCERSEIITSPSPGDQATLLAMYPLNTPTAIAAAINGPAPATSAPLPRSAGAAAPTQQPLSLAAREQVFQATLSNERMMIATLKNSNALERALAAVKRVPDAEAFGKRLPPTIAASSAAEDAVKKLEQAVHGMVQLEAGH